MLARTTQTWIRIGAPRSTNPDFPEGVEIGKVVAAIKDNVS